MAGHTPSNDGDTDWRRLASDRNVSHGVARALWEQARSASPDDPAQAEQAFHLMLDEAEAANITHEPGRETLANGTPSPRDASSLGPGKWTRVLLEQPKSTAPDLRPLEAIKKATAETLRSELAAAGQAGQQVVDALAASDPKAIVSALREIGQGSGLLQKLVGKASAVVERVLEKRASWDVHVTPPPKPKTTKPDENDDEDAPPPDEPPDEAKPDEPPPDEAKPDAPPEDAKPDEP